MCCFRFTGQLQNNKLQVMCSSQCLGAVQCILPRFLTAVGLVTWDVPTNMCYCTTSQSSVTLAYNLVVFRGLTSKFAKIESVAECWVTGLCFCNCAIAKPTLMLSLCICRSMLKSSYNCVFWTMVKQS